MNRARQRKLDARQRRQESLGNFGAVSQESMIVPETKPIVNLPNKTEEKTAITKDARSIRTISVKELQARNKKKNLMGKKITVKGKEK